MSSPNQTHDTVLSGDIAAPLSSDCEPPETFAVDDAESANWVVRKIIEARAYAKHVKRWAQAELLRAEREEQFFYYRYGPQLERWVREQLERGRRKSLKLPAGTAGFRAEPPRLEIRDEQKLIGWCRRSMPTAIRVQTHVLKSLVKDHVLKTGECPDGAEVGGGNQRFYVK
jgi:hypothetical protein